MPCEAVFPKVLLEPRLKELNVEGVVVFPNALLLSVENGLDDVLKVGNEVCVGFCVGAPKFPNALDC